MENILTALRAAAEPSRLRLLAVLAQSELTVSELTQILAQSQPRISRHLKLLAEAGLIDRFREGSWVFYRLADPGRATDPLKVRVAELARTLVGFVREDDPALLQDLRRLDDARAHRAEQAADYFKANAGDWDRIRALHLSDRDVETAMLELIGPGDFNHFVDIGTGTGRILELIGDRAARGDGIDLSQDMLLMARAALDKAGLSHCQVRQADLFALPFQEQTADLVTLHQVLHYLDDPASAIKEAGRILAPGGRLLIVDFAPHELEFLRDEHQHRRLGFADDEIKTWAKAQGLDVLRVRHLAPEAGNGQQLTVSIWLLGRAGASSRTSSGRAA